MIGACGLFWSAHGLNQHEAEIAVSGTAWPAFDQEAVHTQTCSARRITQTENQQCQTSPMTESNRLRDDVLSKDVKRNGIHFVNTELDLGMTFAESALVSLSAGHLDEAKQRASAAKTAFRAVQKFLPKLEFQGEERELMAEKLEKLTHLIEKLSAIK
jgi:Asp-tRNA(Asn)/Glu-tRNA(Gln) amidotransferase C subunit